MKYRWKLNDIIPGRVITDHTKEFKCMIGSFLYSPDNINNFCIIAVDDGLVFEQNLSKKIIVKMAVPTR